MAAAAPPDNFTTLYTNRVGDVFLEPDIDFATVVPLFDAASAALNDDAMVASLMQMAENTPTMVAYVDRTSSSYIQIAHAPTLLGNSPGLALPGNLRDQLLFLKGWEPDTLEPEVLPRDIFAHAPATRVPLTMADTLTLLNAAGAGSALGYADALTAADVAAGTARDLEVRRAVVLPTQWHHRIVQHPHVLTPRQFYDAFIAPLTPAELVTHASVCAWWEATCVKGQGHGGNQVTTVGQYPVYVSPPHRAMIMRRLRMKAHSLLSAGGLAGRKDDTITSSVERLRNTLELQETARAVARATPRAFSEKYGIDMATVLHRLCGVGADAQLPPLLRSLAACKEKSTETSIINMALLNAGQADPNINEINLPRCGPHLLSLLRNHNYVGLPLELGDGLTPFAVVCQGHPQNKDILELATKQVAMESGHNTINLSDADTFKVKDVRFPRTLNQVSDKCRAYSTICQVIFGDTNPFVTGLRAGLDITLPQLLQLESLYTHNPRMAMMLGLRFMYWIQCQAFLYWRKVRVRLPGHPAVAQPDYETLADQFATNMHDQALPRLPDSWMSVVKTQLPELYPDTSRIRGGGNGNPTSPGGGGTSGRTANLVRNLNSMVSVVQKFAAGGFRSVNELLQRWKNNHGGQAPRIPQCPPVGEVCLRWACTNECREDCPRKAAHVHYGNDVQSQICTLIDGAASAPAQAGSAQAQA
jgi:hypothetical protein